MATKCFQLPSFIFQLRRSVTRAKAVESNKQNLYVHSIRVSYIFLGCSFADRSRNCNQILHLMHSPVMSNLHMLSNFFKIKGAAEGYADSSAGLSKACCQDQVRQVSFHRRENQIQPQVLSLILQTLPQNAIMYFTLCTNKSKIFWISEVSTKGRRLLS